jgi:hypothetical protein
MKKLTLIFALGLGLSTAAFAGSPKTNDAKPSSTTASPTENKTGDAVYYWFDTNAAGTTVAPGATAKSNTPTALDPDGCDGNGIFCGLAYDQSKTHIDGSGNRVLNSGETAADRDTFSKED